MYIGRAKPPLGNLLHHRIYNGLYNPILSVETVLDIALQAHDVLPLLRDFQIQPIHLAIHAAYFQPQGRKIRLILIDPLPLRLVFARQVADLHSLSMDEFLQKRQTLQDGEFRRLSLLGKVWPWRSAQVSLFCSGKLASGRNSHRVAATTPPLSVPGSRLLPQTWMSTLLAGIY